jgi:hypothetical protein
MSIEIFVSYADTNKDERLWKALEVHLRPFYGDRKGNAYLWNPHKDIIPGSNRKREISGHLQSAQIFLLLLSSDYFANSECMQQMQYALSIGNQVQVILILLRPCSWQGLGLNDLQIVPRDKKPITQHDTDEAWVQVTEEIQKSIDFLGKKNGSAGSDDSGAPERSDPMPGDTFNVNANNIGTSIMGHNNRTVINNGKSDMPASQHKPANNTRTDQEEAA